MNIAIDVLAILGPDSKNRGIGNYCTSQLKKMFELDKENKYFLINFYEDISLKDILDYSDNVSEHYFYLGKDGFLGREKAFNEVLGDLVKKIIKTHNIDVFYFTSPFDSRVSYNMKWFEEVYTLATLYDIIPYLFKERYLGDKITRNQYMGHIDNLLSINKVLAISQSAKDDVVQQFKIDPEHVDVIYAGTDEWFKDIDITYEDENKLKSIYNIQNQYIMCTGGDDDRKNIASLIIAYSKMPRHLIEKYQLVVACKLGKESEERYYSIANKHNIRDRVILTNFVPLDHLIKLYNLAHIVAFPSQYEGFGLPIVEAMACGTPILTSNNSSLGEIASGAAVLVDPFDINDITRGLVEILENTDLNFLKVKGKERVKQFDWRNVAQTTLNAFNSVRIKIESEKHVPRIAFFTPLPPLKSGISDYSVDILNELSNYFIIDVFIDENYKPECKLADNVTVYGCGQFDIKRNEYTDVIYQMGNSEYHSYMIDYIKDYPGTLVLHDYNLHGLLYHLALKNSNMEKYKKYLYEDYDKEKINKYIDDLSSSRIHPMIYEMSCNGVVANYANKIIVHSDYAKKLLLEKDIKRNVKKIFLYADIKEIINSKEIRSCLNINSNKIVLSAFGHIHETKRIMPLMKAFLTLSNKYDQVVLYLVGEPSISIEKELKQYIKTNNLSDRVIITGYTELNVFEKYIDASDICLNLRYPYNGESSASLMRILSKGKCSVINDLGSFSEVPDQCCVKIKSPEYMADSEEVETIYNKLEELVSNPQLITTIGANARRYAEDKLDIKKIAKEYADFITETQCSSLTEDVLKNIDKYIRQNNVIDLEELNELAKTLSYHKFHI